MPENFGAAAEMNGLACRMPEKSGIRLVNRAGTQPGGDGSAEVLRAAAQGLVEGLALGRDRDDGDGARGKGQGILGDAAAEDDDRNAVTLGDRGHTRRCLAPQGLGVDAALAGEYEVGKGHRRVKPDCVGDELDAGAHPGAEEAEQRPTETSGRASAWEDRG